MIDISNKDETEREAVACATISARPGTIRRFVEGTLPKGDPFPVAKVAGIMAAKNTASLIPYCHPIRLDLVDIRFLTEPEKGEIVIETRVKGIGKTGFEMEAMLAAALSALTLYDMGKGIDRGMEIGGLKLKMKRGGKSGSFIRGDG